MQKPTPTFITSTKPWLRRRVGRRLSQDLINAKIIGCLAHNCRLDRRLLTVLSRLLIYCQRRVFGSHTTLLGLLEVPSPLLEKGLAPPLHWRLS